jgi:predicted secreted protein
MLHSHAELSSMSAQGWRARLEALIPAHITEPADRRRATECATKLYFTNLGILSAETRARKKAARAAAITAIVTRAQTNQEGVPA